MKPASVLLEFRFYRLETIKKSWHHKNTLNVVFRKLDTFLWLENMIKSQNVTESMLSK